MTESHLRRLSVTMRLLEDALQEVTTSLVDPTELIMTTFEQDVPPTAWPEILSDARRLREEIRVVRGFYHLEPQVISNRRRFNAKLSLLSIDLTEATSKYLRAYGEVPEPERRGLDDQIEKMIAMVENLSNLVNRSN
ncbi:MAG: hypothetical protein ACREQR_13160 [Candidatus Binataceae bacterium]